VGGQDISPGIGSWLRAFCAWQFPHKMFKVVIQIEMNRMYEPSIIINWNQVNTRPPRNQAATSELSKTQPRLPSPVVKVETLHDRVWTMPSDAQVERLALSSLISVSNPGNPGALWLHGCMLDPLLQLIDLIREDYQRWCWILAVA